MRSVTVRTGMRLHLGFYRFSDPPFEYGGLGLAVEEPSLSVTLVDEGESSLPEWVSDIVPRILRAAGINDDVAVQVDGFVMRHVGLGTTTRVVLSLLKVSYLMRGAVMDLPLQAWRLGRGRISGVGVWSFMYGGLVVDGGRVPAMAKVPPLVSHTYPPSSWRAVIALPIVGNYAVSESREEPIMREPYVHPKQRELYAAVVRLVSAAHLGLFDEFASSVEKIQELTGEYFSKWQGDIYCCEQSRSLAEKMKSLGLRGVGQSSWGPTVYGFASTPHVAERVSNELIRYMEDVGIKGNVWVTRISRSGHMARVLNK